MYQARKLETYLLGLGSIVMILGLWQMLGMWGMLPDKNIPTAFQVFSEIYQRRDVLSSELIETLRRAAAGLLAAVVTMVPLGVIVGRSELFRDLIEPVVEILRPLPTPAIIPVVMLFAGIGDAAKIAVIWYGAAFPILLNTMDGVRSAHPMLTLTSRSLRLTRLESLVEVYLPASLPQILAGVRTSISIALLISITSEMLLSTNGIGVFLVRSQNEFRFVDGLAGIFVLAIAAFLINHIYLMIDRRILSWHWANSGDRSQAI